MRKEKDSMGEMEVPNEALYGASTQRAVLNFPISGHRMPEGFIRGLGLVKSACATANEDLNQLASDKAELIRSSAREIAEGGLAEQFPVDVFQTGSGTSSNTNINEVIANRASQMVGERIGSRIPIHPNDDVNMGQSSNDIVPTALHVSVAVALNNTLVPSLTQLESSLLKKSEQWKEIVKIGRTHLMDATPLTLGQEFSGYAAQVHKSVERANRAIEALQELAIGGTAVGTGINCHPEFAAKVVALLSKETGIMFREADNHFEAQGGRDDAVEVAGHLNTIAASLTKIAHDVRMLGSGPRSGLGELNLPATQPGSSIMPGKVNPVMSEMLIQVAIYSMGLCHSVIVGGRDGHFELNVTIPLIAYSLHEAIGCLGRGAQVFADRCIDGIEVNKERCSNLVEQSLMLVTALNPHIGYDRAAEVAKLAYSENKTLRQILLEKGWLDEETIDQVLDPTSMV